MPTDFQFASPGFLVLLFAIAAIFSLYWNLRRVRRKALEIFDPSHLLRRVAVPRSKRLQNMRIGFLCGSWLFAVLALAGPEGNVHYIDARAVEKGAGEIIFMVDASESMSVKDTRIGLTRLDSAKGIIETMISEIQGQNVSLFAFTSVLTPLVPETIDTLFLRMMLDQMEINEGGVPGTDLLAVLAELQNYLETRPVGQRQTVILFSDGEDTLWQSLEGREKRERQEQIIAKAEALGIEMITVGIGSLEPVEIPGLTYDGRKVTTQLRPELLRQMGVYFEAEQATTLSLAERLSDEAALAERKGMGTARQAEYDLYFQYPLFLSILLLALALVIPERSGLKGLLIFTLLIGNTLSANDSEKILFQSNENLEAGFYGQAESGYRELLSRPLELWQQDIVLYNLGTAELKRQRWQQAVREFMRIGGDNLPPYLLRPFNRNLALALLGQADRMRQEGYSSFASRLYDLVETQFDIEFSAPPAADTEDEELDIEPLLILKEAVLKEEEALITALRGAVEKIRGEPFAGDLEEAKERQEGVMSAAAPFIPALLSWKREAYRENRCLQKPFDKVVPLFSQGLEMAEKADELLGDQKTFPEAVSFQWEAIDLWTSAIESWSEFDPVEDPERIPDEEDELFRQIIQMNIEDGRPEEEPVEIETVERPW
jgi:Ca-activated chloride channel homolog